jgi:hypothetical protein
MIVAAISAIVGTLTLEPVARLLKWRKSLEPKLGFGLVHAAQLPVEKLDAFPQCVVVDVKNTQTAVANTAKNVTARIRFVHADGSNFTVTSAAWLVRRVGKTGMIEESISSSTDLEGGEEQPFVLLLIKKDSSLVALRNLDAPVGVCSVGHWTAIVRIISDNVGTIEGSIGFTVFRDNRHQFDQPAFLSRSDR